MTGNRFHPARWTMAAAAAGVFVCSWFFRFNDPNGNFAGLTDDHFFYVLRGWQILFGELPVRDFVDHGAPLYFYVSAAVQLLFGRGTLSELAFSTSMLALGAALTFWLAARASGSVLLGLAGALFHVLLSPRFYNYPKILVYAAAIPALWWLADRPGRRPLAVLAVITVAAFLFRHDHGVFVALATGAMLLLAAGAPWRDRVRHAAVYGAFVGALLAPYLLFIQLNGGLDMYFELALDWVDQERRRTPVVWPGLFEMPVDAEGMSIFGRAVEVVRENHVAWMYYLELALPLFALAVLAVSRDGFRPGWPQARQKIAIVALLGVVLDAGFLRSPLDARLADPSVPLAILVAWLAAAVPRLVAGAGSLRPQLRPWGAPIRAAVALAAIPFVFVPVSVFSANLHARLADSYLLEGPGEALRRARTVADGMRRDWNDPSAWTDEREHSELLTLALYLSACTPPDARVFVQGYIPQVLALARRGFAAGHGDLRADFFDIPGSEALALERMRDQDVPVVLLATDEQLENFRKSFPMLTTYFDLVYEAAGTHTFDERFGVTLLVRRDAPAAGVFQPLGWPCPAGGGRT